jgi:transposase
MNVQLTQVLSDITGDTGLKIIRAIITGERDPYALAQLRNQRCKSSIDDIAKALEGNFRPELVFSLRQAVEAYDFFHNQIVLCEREIQQLVESWENDDPTMQPPTKTEYTKKTTSNRSPYSFDIVDSIAQITKTNLAEVPGLGANTIAQIIAEIGTDLSRWPSVKHFVSWLGLCPGNKISGGKVLSSKTKPTSNKAAQALRLAAQALHHSKTALGSFYRKMQARLGAPKAITAAAHKLARIIYNMLKNKTPFHQEHQANYEQRYQQRKLAALKRNAAEMGYELVLAPQTCSA